MAKYNFDKIIDRHNTFSDKWDIVKDKDVIPLWVADMDFKVAPPIQKAVEDYPLTAPAVRPLMMCFCMKQ